MCFGEVLAVGSLTLEQIRYCVGAESVNAHVEPEAGDLEHLSLHGWIIIIQIRLTGIETVPVILASLFIPGPVGGLAIHKNNTRIFIFLVGITPNIIITIGGVPV